MNSNAAQIMDLVNTITSIVSPLLFAIAIFFIKRYIKSTDALTNSNYALASRMDRLETSSSYNEKNCYTKHKIVDTRLNEHSKRLNEHDVQLAKLTKDDK